MREADPKRRVEVDVSVGDKGYFLRQSSSGFVAGPKSEDGFDQHITVATDPETEEIKHVHMKSGRHGLLQENWRIHPNRVMPDVASWIRANGIPLLPEEVIGLGSASCISAQRVLVSASIFEAFASRFASVMIRGSGLVRYSEERHGRDTRIFASIDPNRSLKLMRRLRPFRGPLLALIRSGLPRVLRLVYQLHVIRLKDMAEGDVCIVFPGEGRDPTVVIKHESYLSIPLARVFGEASYWFSRLKISELKPAFDFSPGRALPMTFIVRDRSQKTRAVDG